MIAWANAGIVKPCIVTTTLGRVRHSQIVIKNAVENGVNTKEIARRYLRRYEGMNGCESDTEKEVKEVLQAANQRSLILA